MKNVYIIAEAGVNHNGSTDLAIELINAAKYSGADAVKFQTFNTEKTIKKNAKMATYQKDNLGYEESQYDMVKKLELSEEQHRIIFEYAKSIGITILSTPFDLDSVDLLERMNVKEYKIGSGEIVNFPLIEKIMKTGKPIILSTGMSMIGEIEETVNYILKDGEYDLTLLHCVSNYPPKLETVNLNLIKTLKTVFNIPIGYSDHTIGVEVPIAAVALGAKVIEKHITLDKELPGPDHKVSLDPNEFKIMVDSIRNIEIAMGDGVKRISEDEKEIKLVARKSLVYKNDYNAGRVLSEKDLTYKRPGDGIYPKYISKIIGKKLKCSVVKDQKVAWDELDG